MTNFGNTCKHAGTDTDRSSSGSAVWAHPGWEHWHWVQGWGSAGPEWCPEDWDMYSSSAGPAWVSWERERESQTQTGIISSLEISRAECGEVVQVQHLRKRSSPHLISCATALQLSKPSRTGGTTANKYIVFWVSPPEAAWQTDSI